MVDNLKQVGTTEWEMERLNMFVNFSNCDLMVTYSSVTFPFFRFPAANLHPDNWCQVLPG
jgi:hypothetical protein